MKIALIHGQNHHGSTYHIGRMLAENIADAQITAEFFLPRDLDHFCLGCCRCITDDAACPFSEEKQRIMSALEDADLLIFTTPNYCMNMSAPMKAFIDLTFTYWMSHRPRACMFHKTAAVISTTAGMGAGAAAKSVSKCLFYWGIPKVYRYGIAVQAMGWNDVKPEKKAKIEARIASLAGKLSSGRVHRPGLKTRLFFRFMGGMQKAGLSSSLVEKEYWQERGWLDKKRPWNNK